MWIGSSTSSERDAPRDGEQPVEVAADHLRLGRALAHPLEPAELLVGLLADGLGHVRVGDLGAVLLDDRLVVLAELLPDRVHLLPEEVLALLLLHPGVDVLADALADQHRREPLALVRERELEPLGDVDGLEQLDLLLEAQVGRVAGGVGQGAGVADRADERLDATVVAAQLEDLLHDGAVLGLELARPLVRGRGIGTLLHLDEQAPGRVGLGRTRDAAVQPLERDRDGPARQPDAVGHACDRAHGGVLALVLGDEQDALFVADVDRQRHVHVREDDDVVQRYEQELAHVPVTLLRASKYRKDSWCREGAVAAAAILTQGVPIPHKAFAACSCHMPEASAIPPASLGSPDGPAALSEGAGRLERGRRHRPRPRASPATAGAMPALLGRIPDPRHAHPRAKQCASAWRVVPTPRPASDVAAVVAGQDVRAGTSDTS